MLRIHKRKADFLGWMREGVPGFYKERLLFTWGGKTGCSFLPKLCTDMVSPKAAGEYNKIVPSEQEKKARKAGRGAAARPRTILGIS